MLRVFVALGKQVPKSKAMVEDTAEVGRLLAKYNCTLVQGGAKTGLMGEVLTEFQKYSEEVVLIVPEVHKADLTGTVSKEHYIVEGEADRLKITINTCDLIVVLPGGTGTLAELAYYNETCKSGEHNAKIVMLNTKGFYNKLFKFIKHQTKLGFMNSDGFKFDVINNTKQLELIIQELITKKQAKLQKEELAKQKQQVVKEAKKVSKVKTLDAKVVKEKQPAKKTTSKSTKTNNKKEAKPTKPAVQKAEPKKIKKEDTKNTTQKKVSNTSKKVVTKKVSNTKTKKGSKK